MVQSAVRFVFQALGALVLGLLIAVPVLVWRLSSGPIALDFLTPSIESALTAPDDSVSVELDRTVLALDAGRRMLELRALGVKVFAGGGPPVVTVPQLALTLNGRALLTGVLAPNSVRVYGLKARLVRDETGHVTFGFGDQANPGQAGGVVRSFIDALVGGPDADKPGRSLQRAAIVGADLVVEDRVLGVVWHAPDADLEFQRIPAGLEARGGLTVDFGGAPGRVDGRVVYTRDGDGLDGELRLAGIRPALLGRLGGPLAGLSALDMPLSGTIRAHGTAAGVLDQVSFDLSGDAGQLVLPAPLGLSRKVVGASLRGAVDHGMTRLRVDDLTVDLGGPTLTLSGVADGLGGDTTINADGVLRDVPADALPDLWPAGLAPNPRAWVTHNLAKGMVHEARITLSARSRTGKLEDLDLGKVEGEIHADGLDVDYLDPLPVVRNGACVATFDSKDFRIDVKGGEVYGLHIEDGLIVLSGLDAPDQFADIDLTVAGPMADALKLVDHPPLRYAAALGIKPDAVGGDAVTRLKMKFPLLANLKLADLAIKVHSDVKGARVPGVLLGLDMTQGDLGLDLDGSGMDVAGTLMLGTIPARLRWRENFSAKGVPFRSRYVVQAPRVDEAGRRSLGLDTAPFVAPWIDGPVGATVTALVQPGGSADIEAGIDLAAARMSLPGLGWRKPEGAAGSAEASIQVDRGRLAAVPRFAVAAGDLQVRGSVGFDADGRARRVDLPKASFGRTDVDGAIQFRPAGGMDVTLKGPSFDARSLVHSDADAKKKKKDELPPMSVTAAVGTLWLSDKGSLTNATIRMARDGANWQTMTLNGIVTDGKTFTATLEPAGPQRRALKAVSDDAGGVLRAFDVYDDLVGGSLDVDGTIDDTKADQPVSGTIHISDYNVVHAPALARLLTVAALSGILDVLRGEGIAFTTLDAPFTLADGLLTIDNARAYGAALGLTAKGEFDFDHSRMALEGTVVPAYVFNSALGNIPVLGWLITGGEKGGGLVAFNFSMHGPTQDPDVVVNPLSMLTPGFLRRLFNIFDDGSGTEARRKAPAAEPHQ